MFRARKRKQSSRKIARATGTDANSYEIDSKGSDDVDPSPLLAIKKQKLKKGKVAGLVVRSFDVGEADDEEDDANRKKRKKNGRRRGVGFGGIASAMNDGDDRQEIDFSPHENVVGDTTDIAPSYGKEALERLRSEQKLKAPEVVYVQEEEATIDNLEQLEPSKAGTTAGKSQFQGNASPLASFIALDGADHDDIVDSTERTFIHENMTDGTAPELFADEIQPINAEELRVWEDQIERRAGIKPTSAPNHSRLVSLEDLAQKLQSTLTKIRNQQEELENSTNRRRADYEHAGAERKIQEENLKIAGEACEFYQRLRHDLTLWVGALRELQQKVRPVMEAFQDMLVSQNVDAAVHLDSFQDDCIATLQEYGMLSQVVGRQPHIPTTHGASSIDEFGRDVSSQYLRDRDIRFRSWATKLGIVHSEDPAVMQSWLLIRGMFEDHNEKERSEALQEALRIAVQDLDQQFISVSELATVFDRWQKAYPDEFKQSFASLSYGDLSAVLLQLVLCRSNWFPNMLSESSNRNNLDLMLESFLPSPNSNGSHEGVERALEKAFLPLIGDLLKPDSAPSFLFLSSEKSKLMTDLMEFALKYLEHAPMQVRNLRDTISTAIARTLDGIAIPILKHGVSEKGLEIKEDVQLSSKFARCYIVGIIQEMVCNIITYWLKLIPLDSEDQFGFHSLFGFLNDRFLMLLSSVESELAGTAFLAVWKALNDDPRQPLQSPSFMLMTTPLRAAAQVYRVRD